MATIDIFFSPHPDDEALFGSYIIQRLKPRVIVCTDGTTHEKKFGISVNTRRLESIEAMDIFGVRVEFLGIPEDELTHENLREKLSTYYTLQDYKIGKVFAPKKQGGQPQHDIVSDVIVEMFPQTIFYSTYSKASLLPTGEMAILPTEEEKKLKDQALSRYVTQLRINSEHFGAVRGQPEYINFSNE